MTKLRVIVGFVAAATATMTALNNVQAEHLRSNDEERMLTETAEAETAFLNTFASTEDDSMNDDLWGVDDNTHSSNDLDDILNTNYLDTEPTTTNTTTDDRTPEPNSTTPTSDATAPTDTKTQPPDASTEEPTSSTTVPSSDASVAETPAPSYTSEPVQLTLVAPWEPCGGLNFDYTKVFPDGVSVNWSTRLTCTLGYQCEIVNPWYYQCQQVKDSDAVNVWGQCGGADYHGLTNCTTGSVCKFVNDWYSQCVPKENASKQSPKTS